MILSEIWSWLKKAGKQAFIFKIDFEKAYDNLNWDFLLDMLNQMGFPSIWCKWVKGVLVSARSSVLVNGSPTFEFQCQKGLRQGDPLNPFLFLVVIEALSCLVSKACSVGRFKGVKLPNEGPVVSNLFYADDALIMGEWEKENILTVARILRVFYACSGLKININKSNIFGVGVEDDVIEYMASVVGCKRGAFPFKYLGWKKRAFGEGSFWLATISLGNGRISNPVISGVLKNIVKTESKVVLKGKRLFALEKNKRCWVSNRLSALGVASAVFWDWLRPPVNPEEMVELNSSAALLEGVYRTMENDKWRWSSNVSGQVVLDRIPTKNDLVRRNISVDTDLCALCNDEPESVDHLFTACQIAHRVWSQFCDWVRLLPIFAFSLADILDLYKNVNEDKKSKEIVRGLVTVTCWCLWKARNARIFF
ncbi:uncharacterized protein LOC110882343 [Helianthus annuus]|uniref:uncharacterized protein LOC110882343 n=1 Tax=Helianthus annuus TaxID=4232 RepID=UPI000B8EF7EC|nr:uncharacterized protein LOC110882343 [Helianthus annuus]